MSKTPVYNITTLGNNPPMARAGMIDARPGASRIPEAESPNYWVRRAAVTGLAILAVTAAVDGWRAIEDHNETRPIDTSHTYKEIQVQPGDTLFGIAQRAEPNQDPRRVVDSIALTIQQRDNVSPQVAEQLTPGEEVPLPADSQIGTVAGPK